MAVKIILVNGTVYLIDAWYATVYGMWAAAVAEEQDPIVSFDRLGAGIPLPKVAVDLRQISSLEQEGR